MANNPHDTLFKHALADPTETGAWLALALADQPWSRLVRWRRLRPLDTEHPRRGAAARSDVVFSAPIPTHRALLVLPLEHQSKVDWTMPQRHLGYSAWLLQRPAFRGRPVVIVPVVLYQGRAPWTASRSLHAALGLSEALVAAFDGLLPQVSYVLLDLARAPDHPEVPATIRLAFALLRQGRGGDVWQALAQHATLLPAACDRRGRGYIEQLLSYAYDMAGAPPTREVVKMIVDSREDIEETFVSYADQLREQGRLSGLAEGITKGRQEGRTEGSRAGLIRALLTVLRARFGDLPAPIERRLHAVTSEQLDAWLQRFPSSESLEALFDADDRK
jgi:hypothetical protein